MTTKRSDQSLLKSYGLPGYCLALGLFYLFSAEGYGNVDRFFSWLVFVLGTLPILIFLDRNKRGVPIVELIILAYVLAFSLPIFFETENRIINTTLIPEDLPVAMCLIMTMVAIVSLWIGSRIAPAIFKTLGVPIFSIQCDNNRLFYFGASIVLIGLMIRELELGVLKAPLTIAFSPELGIALIALLYYTGQLSSINRWLALVILVSSVVFGVESARTQSVLLPFIIWFFCRWLVNKKAIILPILAGLIVFVLFQPVKLEYRNIVSVGDISASGSFERLRLLGNLFDDYWLSLNSGRQVEESTFTRTSLLLQTSHVIDMTPKVVPFKNGSTLEFMYITLIPRFIWPDKPTAQEANVDFAIDYGITTVEGTQTTMFGVGHLGDAFMNFGAYGILPLFILIGIISQLPVYVIPVVRGSAAEPNSEEAGLNIAHCALLISILSRLFFIGTSISDTYGGIVQLIVLQGGLLFLFVKPTLSAK